MSSMFCFVDGVVRKQQMASSGSGLRKFSQMFVWSGGLHSWKQCGNSARTYSGWLGLNILSAKLFRPYCLGFHIHWGWIIIRFIVFSGIQGDDNLQSMLVGTVMRKIKSRTWKKQRYFKLQDDCMTIWYKSKKAGNAHSTCKNNVSVQDGWILIKQDLVQLLANINKCARTVHWN